MKYILFCLFGLVALSGKAFAEPRPLTPNGTSDLWAGVPVTTCTFLTGGTDAAQAVVLMSSSTFPNTQRGVLLGVSLSSGAAGEYMRVYDSSAVVAGPGTVSDATTLLPPVPFSPTASSESLAGNAALGVKGLRFQRGLVLGIAAAGAARKGVCLHYLPQP